jgi:hypothetical protein
VTLRVSTVEVTQLIETDPDLDILPFIETANLLVDEELDGKGLSDERLRQIELYLAAHFTSLRAERGQLRRTGTGDSTEVYAGKFVEGFALTRYGQQALMLDTTGTLAALSAAAKTQARKAEFRVVLPTS